MGRALLWAIVRCGSTRDCRASHLGGEPRRTAVAEGDTGEEPGSILGGVSTAGHQPSLIEASGPQLSVGRAIYSMDACPGAAR